MHIFDIIGPVMIGPSSSHTAGAAKIGYVTRKLLGERPVQAEILLHGSFSATGSGHGTDRAIVAGLLGYKPDDERLPNSFAEAEKVGLSFQLTHGVIRNAHPNTEKTEMNWRLWGHPLAAAESKSVKLMASAPTFLVNIIRLSYTTWIHRGMSHR